jgi:hypothetical protein
MTDEQWLRLELKNAQARRRRPGGGVAARVARILHRLVRHPGPAQGSVRRPTGREHESVTAAPLLRDQRRIV